MPFRVYAVSSYWIYLIVLLPVGIFRDFFFTLGSLT